MRLICTEIADKRKGLAPLPFCASRWLPGSPLHPLQCSCQRKGACPCVPQQIRSSPNLLSILHTCQPICSRDNLNPRSAAVPGTAGLTHSLCRCQQNFVGVPRSDF
ncbi:hypothetical protein ETTORE_0382 [Pseudomonas phage Ettore]|nr:hypothetical protein ETTORE_0382 [Pseudomonas phage Ettore]